MPKELLEAIQIETEIRGFMFQSNISKKNISRLKILAQSDNQKVRDKALLVLEVAKVKPHKKKRIRFLARHHRELLKKLGESDLIFDFLYGYDEMTDDSIEETDDDYDYEMGY